jgi:2-(1,2-epoxy-1,2-dihydrophenyl)acetyl-CoA isomerase
VTNSGLISDPIVWDSEACCPLITDDPITLLPLSYSSVDSVLFPRATRRTHEGRAPHTLTSDANAMETRSGMVLAEIADGVGTLTLNRPERRNALHPDMYDAIAEVLERYASDSAVGCVLITGAGAAFCAGGDVRMGVRATAAALPSDATSARVSELVRAARIVRLLHEMPQVTIAALPGPAVGAGMSLALAADLRIAAQSASLIPGWGKLAFSGDFGGVWFLNRLVGPSRAIEILIDDTPVDADTALAWGLINRAVPDAELPAAAFDWARTIAAGPSTAWRGVKANVGDAATLSLDDALVRESERMIRCGLTEDHRNAVRAWLDATRRTGQRGPPSTGSAAR